MTTFCTLSDQSYMYHTLALISSLKRHASHKNPSRIYWLCLDDGTFDVAKKVAWRENTQLFTVYPYRLTEMEEKFTDLQKAKTNPPSKYGTQYSQYCWCLTPWFCDYLLERGMIATDEYLIYVDSDIYFYQNPQMIVDRGMNGKSIGIHTHRFEKEFHETETGYYNVGVVLFKNNMTGRKAAKLWRNWLIDPGNEHYKTHGSCGDQKYIELFKHLYFPNDTSVFDQEGCILHYAPWCTHPITGQDPLFCHFSHFKPNFEEKTWTDSFNGEWNPAAVPHMHTLYTEYFSQLLACYQLVCSWTVV